MRSFRSELLVKQWFDQDHELRKYILESQDMIEIINHKENSHDLTGRVGEVCMVIFSSRLSDEACLQKRRVRGRISQRLKTFFPLVEIGMIIKNFFNAVS